MSKYRPIRAKTFRAWFKNNLMDYAKDIANHGADAGYPYITYNTEAARLFDKFGDEIWNMATEDAEAMGNKSVMEFIAGFRRKDMAEDLLTFKVLMVWYAAEKVAYELAGDE
jgi:hypothetical protein